MPSPIPTRASARPGAPRALVLLLLVLALSAPASAAVAQVGPPADLGPSGFALAPPSGLLVEEETTPAGPGMRLVRFDTLDARGFVRGQALDVDLGVPGVTAELLTAPSVADTEEVSSMVERQGAVAGVNGDFFDINRSGSALRAEVTGGELRKGPVDLSGAYAAFGGDEGLGGLAQVALDGTVTTPDGPVELGGLNQSGLAAGAVGAFTPVWGTYPRAAAVGTATQVREVVVADGRVTAVADGSTDAPIPSDGFVLLGRDAGATALAGLEVGDAVGLTYAPRSSDGRTLDVAVGGNVVLVRDGELVAGLDDAAINLAPRTAVGFADGGRRMFLVTVDGRQRDSRGLTIRELGALLERMGADEALNLDGGGSTTMVAREPGEEPGIRNNPSDGFERQVPNGLGVLAPAGSGRVTGLDVVGGADDDEHPERVFPGLTRSFTARGYDETVAPVGLPRTPTWQVDDRDLARVTRDGTVTGRAPGTTTLTARVGRATGTHELRVLGQLAQVTTSPERISLGADTDRGRFSVIGLDADGYRAQVGAADVELEYDESVLRIDTLEDGSYEVVPLQSGQSGALVTIRVGDRVGYLSATVGLEEVLVEDFEDLSRWSFSSARASGSLGPVAGEDGGQALGLTYDFTGAGQPSGTRAAYANANPRLPIPGAPLRLGLDVLGDGQNAWLRAVVVDAAGTSSTLTLAPNVTWTGWRYIETELPAGLQFPLELRQIYPVETNASRPYSGTLAFDDLVVKVPTEVEVPESADARDPIVVQNGALDEDRWTFAVMNDSEFVRPAAGQPENDNVRLARRAMREIVGATPDFVVIAGDLIDTNPVTNVSFAAEVIAQELGDVPVYYIPGNHEVLGDGRITNFAAQFGETRFTFDHEGTRFLLLNTAFGSLRASEYAQLPELRAALDDAVDDPAVEHVVVLPHHPTRDPNPQAASQISDRKEAELIETWLTEFREESGGKGAAYIAGHAHVADLSRRDGVPYLVLPPTGAKIYGPQDDGGFSAWSLFGVRSGRAGTPAPGEEWLRVESRPLADALEVAPPTAAVGATVDVDAVGVLTQGRRFPLRYPATVRWEGSEGIVVATGPEAAAAVASGEPIAVLDPITLQLTGVRAGSGELTVTAGSLTATVPVAVGSEPSGPVAPSGLAGAGVLPVPAALSALGAGGLGLLRRRRRLAVGT